MKTIQPFIDLGWYTVPLKGVISRLEDGTKTIPNFERNWKNIYANRFNEEPSALGGVITGKLSGIIAVDCDNQDTYDLFKSQVPDYEFVFDSLGKLKGGGTFIFKYDPDLELLNFNIHNQLVDLEVYSNDGFIYLPSDLNTSKVNWGQETKAELPQIIPIPTKVRILIIALYEQYKLSKVNLKENSHTQDKSVTVCNHLAPQVELFISRGFNPSLFKILTPRDFRDLPQYIEKGYLHPANVPDSRGSEYLSKVSAILGADPSINGTVYHSAMRKINQLWDNPMDSRRLDSTILVRMMEGEAKIDNVPIWKYNENWKAQGMSFTNKLGEAIEVFFDDLKLSYYLINYTLNRITQFARDNDIFSYIETVGNNTAPKKELKVSIPLVRTVSEPGLEFGFYKENEYSKKFNLFSSSPALTIFNNPEKYKEYYNKPSIMLRYLESLIPDMLTMDYVLMFLKHKFATFNYSPIILYFLGVPGSGKDTFVKILATIIGENAISIPSAKEFLDKYNGWLLDTYFIQLDEYGKQLNRFSDKEECLGKILAYSGKSNVQIRSMRNDGYQYNHRATFIMTANNNPLMITEDDRRVVLIDTPNKLAALDWVIAGGGVAKIVDRVLEQVNDFCYYLATEVKDIRSENYVTPPNTVYKKNVIASKLNAGPRIVYLINNGMFKELQELSYEHNIDELFDNARDGFFLEDSLYDLYLTMTEGKGTRRSLAIFMDEGRIRKHPTTRKGAKAYVYKIPELMYYTPNNFDIVD